MLDLQDRVIHHFHTLMGNAAEGAECLPESVALAGQLLAQSILKDGKILVCGNGASGANGQHFCSALLGRLQHERPSLPAINLAADALGLAAGGRDAHLQEVFSRQVQALGQPGDVLLALSDQGQCGNILQAMQAAHDRAMQVVSVCVEPGGDMAALLYPGDVAINLPVACGDHQASLLQLQLMVVHGLCDLIDQQLFGSND